MSRRWILIGQSFLKTIRTIEDKNIPSKGGEEQTCKKSQAVLGGMAVNGLSSC